MFRYEGNTMVILIPKVGSVEVVAYADHITITDYADRKTVTLRPDEMQGVYEALGEAIQASILLAQNSFDSNTPV